MIHRRTRSLGLVAALALFIAPMAATTATAGPGNGNGNGGNPHWNVEDGCQHGNSGKPCRPDPQPDRGKDCLPHGKWGGINEDHCGLGPVEEPI